MVAGTGRNNGMAYFARQKRQTKTYWAELGFMALGLFGLQPSLFTNLLSVPQPNLSAVSDPFYAAYQSRHQSKYFDYWNVPSLTLASDLYGANAGSFPQSPFLANSYSPAINTLQPSFFAAQYPQSANVGQLSAYSQQPLYAQAAYAPPYSAPTYSQQYSIQPNLAQQYATGQNQSQTAQPIYSQPNNQLGYNQQNNQTGYGQQASNQQTYGQTASNSSIAYPQSQNFASQSTYQPYRQPTQSGYQQNQNKNIWPNAASYLAQVNPTLSAPLSASSLNGNNGGNYPSNSAFQSNNYAGARASPYNTYEPFTAQPSLFGNGAALNPYSSNSYYSGSNYGATSAQSYPYQTTNNGGLQRYRAPASPLYR